MGQSRDHGSHEYRVWVEDCTAGNTPTLDSKSSFGSARINYQNGGLINTTAHLRQPITATLPSSHLSFSSVPIWLFLHGNYSDRHNFSPSTRTPLDNHKRIISPIPFSIVDFTPHRIC